MTSWQAAREYDATLAAARDTLTAGLEQANQATATILPRLDLVGTGEHQREEYRSGDPTETATERTSGRVTNWSVQLAQPIYDANAFATRSQLLKETERARIAFRVAEQDLILRTAQACFDVLVAQTNLTLVRAQKQAVSQQLAQAKKTFELGLATITDKDEAQARYDTILATEIAARSTLQLAAAAYTNLTGLDPGKLQTVGDTTPQVDTPRDTLASLLAQTEQHNLALQAERLGLDIAKSEIDRYRLSHSPIVQLVASYGREIDDGSISSSGWRDRTDSGAIGVQVTVPLFSGGSRSSLLRQAKANASASANALEALNRDVKLQTQQFYLDVVSGAARLHALDQARISGASALQSSKTGRDVGVRTTLDVLNAEQTYYQTLYDRTAARYQYLFSRLQLAASLGELTDQQLVSVNTWLNAPSSALDETQL
ncbi:TolC family outer membrane protein [Steroidobacter sp.]|uniref:TolC family outer membrane protein n=1 Tax=Steroidobacter sp. TaxID=1978227 RepID=UPI001A5F1AD4|nr:TolC family outer membrane protein [Steroidobacter sp.]MBL8270449.1 TolC family outer membrane protein [Steroidobacter sp.]